MQGCHRAGLHNHPLDLLSAICRDPKVALYPISLTVECCGRWEKNHTDEDLAGAEDLRELPTDGDVVDYWKSDDSTVARIMADNAYEIQESVMTCGYFNKKGRENWFGLVQRGNRGATLALLLTLLPNLETLECYQYTWRARHFKEIFRHITNPRGRKASKMHKRGANLFIKLREVKFDGCEGDEFEQFFEDFDLAAYFAKLPSMGAIHVNLVKNRSRQNNNLRVEVGSCTFDIEQITVIGGEMNATYMSCCLGSVKALRKFDYGYSNSSWVNTYALDRTCVIIILRALLEHANTSLEMLSLHSGPWSPLEGSVAIPLTLKPFEKLKEATLSCHLWAPVFINDNENPQKIRSDGSKLFRPSQLKDILPGSIVEIKFYGKVAMKHVGRMLQGLIGHKGTRPPCLEKIVFGEVADTERPTVAKMAQR